MNRTIITVVGKDTVGILAKVSGVCADVQANVAEVTQSIMQEYFAMIMLVDISGLNVKFADFADKLSALGQEKCLDIRAMHEDIFNSMHHI